MMMTTAASADCSFLTVKNAAVVTGLAVAGTLTATTAIQLDQNVSANVTTGALHINDAAVLEILPSGALSVAADGIVCAAAATSIGNAFAPSEGVTTAASFPGVVLNFTSGVLTSTAAPRTIMTINTANVSTGSSDAQSFALPLVASGTYNFTVDWGDGSPPSVITAYNQPDVVHTYLTSHAYILTITGTLSGWAFVGTGDRLKLLDISSWGDMVLDATGTLNNYFQGCSNMNISATTGSPLRAGTTSLLGCFAGCTALNSANVSAWDVSAVQDMMAMFAFASSFNADLSSWDTSSVTTMRQMFFGAASFNADLSAWDTSAVTDMHWMFYDAQSFNNGDVGNLGVCSRGASRSTRRSTLPTRLASRRF